MEFGKQKQKKEKNDHFPAFQTPAFPLLRPQAAHWISSITDFSLVALQPLIPNVCITTCWGKVPEERKRSPFKKSMPSVWPRPFSSVTSAATTLRKRLETNDFTTHSRRRDREGVCLEMRHRINSCVVSEEESKVVRTRSYFMGSPAARQALF